MVASNEVEKSIAVTHKNKEPHLNADTLKKHFDK